MYSRNELGKYFQDHYKTGLGVEVGVQNGYYSQELLKDWKGELKCVDNWVNIDWENTAEANLGRDRMIKGDSADSASLFENESLDFVYIDAGHRYEEVKRDIDAWYPKEKRRNN